MNFNKSPTIYICIVALVGLLILVGFPISQAAINEELIFQGKLQNADGTNVDDGAYNMIFKIYTVAEGGTAIYTETWNTTTTFSSTINDTTPPQTTDTYPLEFTYTDDASESTLKEGQTLYNLTKKDRVEITSGGSCSQAINTTNNTICITKVGVNWSNGDSITTRPMVKDGIFSVRIGSLNPDGNNLLTSIASYLNQDLWLGVQVGADSEMRPRKKLGSVPWALASAKLAGPQGETIDNEVDGLIRIIGNGGADNTDLYINLDGTYPTLYSQTDSQIGINDDLVFVGSHTLSTSSGALTIQTGASAGADDIIFQLAGAEKMRILENGDLFFEKGTYDLTLAVTAPSANVTLTIPALSSNGNLVVDNLSQTLTNKTLSTGSTWQGNVISVTYGGTGLSSVASGALLYGSGGGTLNTLSIGSAGTILSSSGSAPQWSTLSSLNIPTGTGTANTIAKWTGTNSLGNSIITDNGTLVTISGQLQTTATTTLATSAGNIGIGTTNPSYKLDVQGGDINVSGSLRTGGTARIDSSGNLSNIGTISSTYLVTGASYVNLTNSAVLQVGGTTVLTSGRALQNLTGIVSSGTIQFTGLTANRLVATDGSSNLTTTISSANLAASVTDETGSGLLVFNSSPSISSPTLSGTIGGTYTIGGTPTLGASLTGSGSPNITGIGQFSGSTGVFSSSVTSPSYTGTGAVTVSSGGTSALTLDSASGLIVLNDNLYFEKGTYDLTLAVTAPSANVTLTIPALSSSGNLVVDNLSQTLTNKTLSTGSTWQGNVIATTYGGTGLSSYTAGDILYYSSGTSLSKLGIGSANYVLYSTGSAPAWGTIGASSITPDSLDFTEFKDAMTLDANLTISASASNYSIDIDSGTLFVDTANNRVGIGTTGPISSFTVSKEITHSYPTPGTTTGSIHIRPNVGTNDNSMSITFGANNNGLTYADQAQAGIYVQSSGAYGNKMYFATTNSYATGAQVRMTIDHEGKVGIGDTSPAALLTVGNGDLFQVNSSGAIAAATGITSSGTITFSGLTTNGPVIVSNGVLSSEAQLAIARGGTNTSATPTAGAIAYGTGSAYAFSAQGSANQVLISGGAGTPTWSNIVSLMTAGTNISISGTTNATIATIANPTFSTSVTSPLFRNDGNITIDAFNAAANSLITLTNSNATYVANVNLADGSLQTAGTTRLTNAGALTNITGITSSGTITFSGLTADRLVTTTTGGQLTNSISSANLAASVTDETGSGLLVFNSSPSISSPTLSGTIGGTYTIGGTPTLGASLTGSGSPNITGIGQFSGSTGVFSSSVTSPSYTGTGAVTVSSGGTSALTLDSASGLIVLNDNLYFEKGTYDLTLAVTAPSANVTLTIPALSSSGNLVVDNLSQTLTNKTLSTGSTWQGNVIATTYGGTGLSSYTAGDILYYSSGTSLSKLGIGSANYVLYSTGSAPAWGTIGASSITPDSLDFTEFKDAMTLDANLTISASASNYSIDIDSGTLFVDTANNRVGIGTTGPISSFTVSKEITHSYPTPGTTTGSIHIRPNVGTNDNSMSITFGANNNGLTYADQAQAGIYVQSSGAYGNKMYFATTNSYATGAQVRMTIDHEGKVGIGDTSPAALLTVGNGDLFQVNSSGAIAAATGITSSGTITFSGLTTNGPVIVSNGVLSSEAQLAIARGGTNTSATPTAGAIAYGTGSAYAFSAQGSANQVLISGGAGTPTWSNIVSLMTAGTNISISGTTNATIATIANPTFSTSVTSPLFRNDGNITIDAFNAAANSLITLTNSNATYVANVNLADGSLQTAGTTRLTNAGALTNITGITSSGTITFSGLTADRLVTTTTGGQLTNSISSANLAASVTDETGSGLLVFNSSPSISSPSLSGTIGGTYTIGGTPTLGSTLTGSGSPNITGIGQFSGSTGVFSSSVTSPSYTGTGAVTVSSGGTSALTLDSASGLIVLNDNLYFEKGTYDLTLAVTAPSANVTLTIPALSSNGNLVVDNLSQTLTNKTLSTGSTWQGNVISVTYGGTGLSSVASGALLYGSGGTALNTLSIGSAGTILSSSGSAPQWSTLSSLNIVTGSGTANTIAKWTGTNSLGNSIITDDGSLVTVSGQFRATGTTTLATTAGNVGIGTTAPGGKLNINAGDLIFTSGTNYGTWRYGAKLSVLDRLKGRQINNNPDFLEGLSSYAVYDNNGSGSITLSLLTDDTAPNTAGRVMQIDHANTGTPSPGWGGFYKAFSRCSGTAVGQCYREGNRIVYRIWAKIPSGYTINFASNAYGTGGNYQWISSQAGTGNWEEYIAVQTIGSGGTFSSTGFWYITGGTRPFTWYVASVDIIDIDQPADTDRASELNIGYKKDVVLGSGSLLTTGASYLAVDSGSVGIGTTGPNYKLDVQGGDINVSGSLRTGGTARIDSSGNLTNIGTISSTYLVTGASYVNLTGSAGLQVGGTLVLTSGRALQNLTGIISSGTIQFTGLTANRLVATDGSSNLTTTISSANVAASVTDETGSGLLVFNSSPSISSPTLSGTIGGTYTIGGTPTLGSTLTGSGSPNITGIGQFSGSTGVFSSSVTSPSYTGTGAVTVSSGGTSALTLDSASGLIVLNDNLYFEKGTYDLTLAVTAPSANVTLTIPALSSNGNLVIDNLSQTLTNKTLSTGSTWQGNVISVTYGGTGLSSVASGALLYGSGGTALNTLPIGSAGTILSSSGSAPQWSSLSSLNIPTGTGTANTIAKWTGTNSLGNSIITDDGSLVTVSGQFRATGTTTLATTAGNVGIGTTAPNYKLTVSGGDIYGSNNLYIAGNVGIGTTNPAQKLHVEGQCVTGDTKLAIFEQADSSPLTAHRIKEVQIKDVKPGQYVYSLNEKTGKVEPTRINKLLDMGVKPIFKLVTDSGKEIKTTGNHPYLAIKSEILNPKSETNSKFEIPNLKQINPYHLTEEYEFSNAKVVWENKKSAFGADSLGTAYNTGILGLSPTSNIADQNALSSPHTKFGGGAKANNVDNKKPWRTGDLHPSDPRRQPEARYYTPPTALSLYQEKLQQAKWTKVIYLEPGDEIATVDFNCEQSAVSCEPYVLWEKIKSIEFVGYEQVYDIEVEGTHNFVANGIIAHNTYISGNVGIGTTNPTLAGGGAPWLTIVGTRPGIAFQETDATANSKLWRFRTDAEILRFEVADDATVPQEWLRVTRSGGAVGNVSIPSGNVGIGTTDPGSWKLNVNGGIYASTGIQTGWFQGNSNAVVTYPYSYSSSDALIVYGNTGSAWAERMRVTAAGNVGIGTTGPQQKLHFSAGSFIGLPITYPYVPTSWQRGGTGIILAGAQNSDGSGWAYGSRLTVTDAGDGLYTAFDTLAGGSWTNNVLVISGQKYL